MREKAAREKFIKGERVRMTAAGVKQLLGHTKRDIYRVSTGVVVGFARGYGINRECVRVRRDGFKTIHVYHMDFWESGE